MSVKIGQADIGEMRSRIVAVVKMVYPLACGLNSQPFMYSHVVDTRDGEDHIVTWCIVYTPAGNGVGEVVDASGARYAWKGLVGRGSTLKAALGVLYARLLDLVQFDDVLAVATAMEIVAVGKAMGNAAWRLEPLLAAGVHDADKLNVAIRETCLASAEFGERMSRGDYGRRD